jgi:carboxypeptidase C (cathepsin A)
MLFRLLVPALMWAGSASAALQVPFADPLPTAERSQGIAAQLNASAFSFDEYAHLTHAGFPNHRVRAKKTHVCDGTAECAAHSAYTGYIDVGARHLFFYFFKSRRDWTKDDLVFWSTGGPGCSSALSLFMENGAFVRRCLHRPF